MAETEDTRSRMNLCNKVHTRDTSPFTQARTRHAGHGTRDTADGTRRTHAHTHVLTRAHANVRENASTSPSVKALARRDWRGT